MSERIARVCMRVHLVQACRGYHFRGLSREQCVLQCMGEGEANGGGDGMAVGPMGVESDRG
jgi:hypothetical protein